MSEYTCAKCHGKFIRGWTDEEAEAEYDRNFSGNIVARDIVCDDCYKAMGLGGDTDGH